jgi:hypothetical protein
MINFSAAYRILYKHLHTYSGSQFINLIRLNDPDHPDFSAYIDARREQGLSTIRKVYFKDILFSYDEERKLLLFMFFLHYYEKAGTNLEDVHSIRALLTKKEPSLTDN